MIQTPNRLSPASRLRTPNRFAVANRFRVQDSSLLSQALAAWFPHSATLGGQVIPEYNGTGPNMLNGGTSSPTTNDAEFLPYDPSVGGYAAFDGVAGDGISMPTVATGSGVFQCIFKANPDLPGALEYTVVAKRQSALSYQLNIDTSGKIRFSFRSGGVDRFNAFIGTMAIDYSKYVSFSRDPATGSVTVESSTDLVDWTTVETGSSTAGQIDTNLDAITLGYNRTNANQFLGALRYVSVSFSGVGAYQFNADLATQSGYTDPVSGQTWTPGAEVPIVNAQSGSLYRGNGSNQFLEVADSAVPAVADGAEKTIVLRGSYFAASIGGGRWLASDNGSAGWGIRPTNTEPQYEAFVRASSVASLGSPTDYPNQYKQVALVFTATHVIEYVDGVEVARVSRPAGALPDSAFRVFRDMAAGVYQKGLFAGCAFFDRALSPSELTQLNGEMINANRVSQIDSSGDMVLTVSTVSADETFTLPLQNYSTDITIDWGDGSNDSITAYNDPNLTHSYASPGTHEIRILSGGTFGGIYFNNGGDRLKLLAVEFGNLAWQSCNGAFRGCSNLVSATGAGIDTSAVTRMGSMFRDCTSLVSLDVSGFNTSSAADMGSMFRGCPMLTSLDVSGFNTSSATVMSDFLNGTSVSTAVYDAALIYWDTLALQPNVNIHMGSSTYSAGAPATARANIIADHNWTFTDGGQV